VIAFAVFLIAGEPRLIGCAGVADKLFHRRVSADRHNLVGAASGLREPTTGRLAQPVRLAAFRQPGRVAPVSKLLTECVAAVWLAGRGDQETSSVHSAWRRAIERVHEDVLAFALPATALDHLEP
jgi:hypothetical protein